MIGVIADDVTGATDVAAALRREGLRTLLCFGVPVGDGVGGACDAMVVALKVRMSPSDEAVAESLRALAWLRQQRADLIYFKYCSTFDSTDKGNIGPVLDRLADALGAATVVTTPSSPEHGRTVYMGHLFLGDVLLSESHMAHHPLTPMKDSSVPRLLAGQTSRQVALIPLTVVRQGAEAIQAEIAFACSRGARYIVVDGVEPVDLDHLARAVLEHPLVSGAAGLAHGLAVAARKPASSDFVSKSDRQSMEMAWAGDAAVLAGSCSDRTLQQVDALLNRGHPSYYVDPIPEPDAVRLAAAALQWFDSGRTAGDELAPLFYSSMSNEELQRVQRAIGVQRSAGVVEQAMSEIAAGLVERGVRRLVIAGGETSGAIVSRLGVRFGVVATEAAVGVPWILASCPNVALLLKSGNFGPPDLLVKASTNRPLSLASS